MTTPVARRVTCVALALLICGFGLPGCSHNWSRQEADLAAAGYDIETVEGAPYRHRVYRSPARHAAGALHVYIEHDGQPWSADGTRPLPDPTPRRPVMLPLMRLDKAPSVYLGRPCHFGLADSPPCDALSWTHGRYSAAVVDSMATVIRRERVRAGAVRVNLFGHSGGGTLAVLLAGRLQETDTVITLGGNLAVAAWARLHGYSPLTGSLDPATDGPLPPSIRQIHYVGEADRVTPPALAEDYARTHPGARVVRVPGVDHLCCWEDLWREALRQLPAPSTSMHHLQFGIRLGRFPGLGQDSVQIGILEER